MFCMKCGKVISDNSNYCVFCGSKIVIGTDGFVKIAEGACPNCGKAVEENDSQCPWCDHYLEKKSVVQKPIGSKMVANDRMKCCDTCHREVAKSASICPSCGARLKKSCLHWCVISILIVVVFAIGLCIVHSLHEPKLFRDLSTLSEDVGSNYQLALHTVSDYGSKKISKQEYKTKLTKIIDVVVSDVEAMEKLNGELTSSRFPQASVMTKEAKGDLAAIILMMDKSQ